MNIMCSFKTGVPLWAHPYKVLTEPSPLLTWTFVVGSSSNATESATFALTATGKGTAHAVAVWMEYSCAYEDNNEFDIVDNTAPDVSRQWASQGIRLLEEPRVVATSGQLFRGSVECSFVNGAVRVDLNRM
eukprot:SAG31_NODE_2917_length_4915_cov_1.456603_3_plen_131_part_00